LGRLHQVCREWRCWEYAYDPLGRLAVYTPLGAAPQALTWLSEEGADHRLLAVGDGYWMESSGGVTIHGLGEYERLWGHGLDGKLRRYFSPEEHTIRTSYLGYPIGVDEMILGRSSQLIPEQGGPAFCAGVALEPLSGQRLDGRDTHFGMLKDCGLLVDLDVFESRSIYDDPLALLQALGMVQLPEDKWTVSLEPPSVKPSYISSALERGVGPKFTGHQIPLDITEPLIKIYATTLMQGGPDPFPDAIVKQLLRSEIVLKEPYPGALRPTLWWMDDSKAHPSLAEHLWME